MNKEDKKKKREALASVINVNRVFALCILVFLISGVGLGILIPQIPFDKAKTVSFFEVVIYILLALPVVIFSKTKCAGAQEITPINFNFKTLKAGVICACIAYPAMLTANYLVQNMNVTSEISSDSISETIYSSYFIISVLKMAILPAFIEELIFRGALLGVYSKKNVFLGILLSSFLFSLMHGNLYQIPYTLIGGIIFSIAVYLTDNLGTSIVAHFIINFFSIIIAYVEKLILNNWMDHYDTIEGYITGIIMAIGAVVLCVLTIKLIKKEFKIKPIKIKESEFKIHNFLTPTLMITISILLLLTLLVEGINIPTTQ